MHVLHGGLRRNALREQLSFPISRAQRVADRVHLQIASLRGFAYSIYINEIEISNPGAFAALLFYNLVHEPTKRKLHLFDPTISFAIPLKEGRSYVPLHFH